MSPNSTCVLVVDDEPVDLVIVKLSLERAGLTVLTATDYDEGMQVFNTYATEIRLLLTDISLPGKTGIDLARECLQRKPGLKILFMSGWVGAEILEYVHIPKCDPHFLRKPFRSSTLLDRARQVLASPEPNPWFETNSDNADSETAGG